MTQAAKKAGIKVTVELEPEWLQRLDEEAVRMGPHWERGEAVRELVRRSLGFANAEARVDAALCKALMKEVTMLDALHRYGGVVPLPALRAQMTLVAPWAGRAAIDAAIVELERRYVIDLGVHQSPATLAPQDRSQGIERPGRGLAYYICARS